MPRIKKNQFDKLNEQLEAVEVREQSPTAERKGTRILNQRQEIVASVQGKSKAVRHIQWNPKRIRLWAGHNRDYTVLSVERCQDLIDGFERAGQQFPAIVRKVQDADQFDYEIICGARRHWTATHLDIDLLVEERQLSDKEAFLLQDIENRDREDICDYERACDYAQALPIYFDGKQQAMADQLQIDKGNFSRLMALSKLPQDIVDAYGDIRDLYANHMSTYNKLLKDPTSKKRVISAAKKLKAQSLGGKEVLKLLKQAANPEPAIQKPNNEPRVQSWTRNTVSLTQSKTGGFVAEFKLPEEGRGRAILEIRRDFLSLLGELERGAVDDGTETVSVGGTVSESATLVESQ